MKRTGRPLLVTFAGTLALLCGCGDDEPAQGPGGAAPSELAGWGPLARVGAPPRRMEVGQDGGELRLDDEVRVVVPAGAFAAPASLEASEIELPLPAIAFPVKASRTFVVRTRKDHGRLGKPVHLEVPVPEGRWTVMTRKEEGWRRVEAVSAGPGIARIRIDHFSGHVFSILEWFASVRERLDTTLETAGNPKHPLGRERSKQEKGPPGVRAFFGVKETAPRSMKENCRLIQELVASYTHPEQFAVPEGSSLNELGLFLHAAKTPEQHGGYFHDVVAGAHERIHRALLSKPEPVSPAGLLRIAIDACDGNVPRGVLAAHNYLKDVTYRGRDSYDGGNGLPEDCGLAAAKLETWRTRSSIAEGGYYDKMGPLYHVFAAMTATVWGGRLLGKVAVEGESFLRGLSIGADHPDMEKFAADACGMKAGLIVLARMGLIEEEAEEPARPRSSASVGSRKDREPELRYSKTTPFVQPRLTFRVRPDDGEWTIARVTVDGQTSFVFEGKHHGYHLRLPTWRPSYDVTIDLRTAHGTFHEQFQLEVKDYREPDPVDEDDPYWRKMRDRLQGYLEKEQWGYAAGEQKRLAMAWQATDPERYLSMMEKALAYCRKGDTGGDHFYLGPILGAALEMHDLARAEQAYQAIPERFRGNHRRAMFEGVLRITGDLGAARKYWQSGKPIPEHLERNRL